ncbi:conserved hypothetical protein [Pyrenophora tritici-repentis Pt-1C-BFP]|uniref:Heterokaryon incompatibility domain-containing protein n=1 Tax=Pyrenophora tritici-repentis (strain Pt-1C-BFP) TaxID=426418 RepID=B2WGW5_PYRTR|nr:uncharacterized protein PTRG_09171 [Pyrenophora tritici-repentis Pt-1C-BFP]EDU42222.1 conserved hypothetical protein [Pyrenophora tritici-repentis Pt-1C-BFP]
MSDIYGAAQLTIIAAAGEDPSYGLPGVGIRPTPQIYHFENINQIYLVTQPEIGPSAPSIEASTSRWHSRAWTFQECFSSRRRLFFTDTAVFFICKLNKSLAKASELEDRLKAYTSRQLSYDSDALNAILSTLESYESSESPVYHIRAIPVFNAISSRFKNQGCSFSIALNFYHTLPCRRRHEFPSWSVLGWQGEAKWLSNPLELDYRKLSLSKSTKNPDDMDLVSVLIENSSTTVTEQPRYIQWKGPVISASVFRITTPFWRRLQMNKGVAASCSIQQEEECIALAYNDTQDLLLLTSWSKVPFSGASLLCMITDAYRTHLTIFPNAAFHCQEEAVFGHELLILEETDGIYQRIGHCRSDLSDSFLRHRETG